MHCATHTHTTREYALCQVLADCCFPPVVPGQADGIVHKNIIITTSKITEQRTWKQIQHDMGSARCWPLRYKARLLPNTHTHTHTATHTSSLIKQIRMKNVMLVGVDEWRSTP